MFSCLSFIIVYIVYIYYIKLIKSIYINILIYICIYIYIYIYNMIWYASFPYTSDRQNYIYVVDNVVSTKI